MSDISTQQMDDLLASLSKAAGSLGKIADKMTPGSRSANPTRTSANNTLKNDLNTARKNDTNALKDHFVRVRDSSNSFNALSSTMKKLAEGFVAFEIINKVVGYGKETVKTYQDLSNYGESFGGSMIKMSQQAAAAGLPLETFAKIIKNNNVVVGQMGVQSFMALNKQIRQLTERSGMYGYSMEQLGDLTGSYLDQQRLAGKNLKDMTAPSTATAIKEFALNVTTISDALGAQRDEVLKAAMSAMQDSTFLAQERINTANGLEGANKAIQGAITDLAAQPGEAGKQLSNMMSQAFGSPGGSIFTDLGKELASLGQGNLTSVIDQANQRLAAGADQHDVAMDVVQQFHDQLTNPDTLRTLQTLAMNGNTAARSVLAMAEQLKTYTRADIEKAKKDRETTDNFTAFFASFQSIFEGIKGAFIDGFLSPFMKLGKLDPTVVKNFWDTIQNELGPAAKELGASFGSFVTSFLSKSNIDAMIATTTDMLRLGKEAVHYGGIFISGLIPIVKAVIGVFSVLHSVLGIFGKKVADVGTAVAVLVTFLAGPFLLKMLAGALMRLAFGGSKAVFVSGRIVTVMGGAGGLGGGGLGGGAGGAAAEAEQFAMKGGGAAVAAEQVAANAAKKSGFFGKMMNGAGKMLGLGGKVGARVGGGVLGRLGGAFLPGVGAALDVAGAVHAAKEGNWLASGLYGAGGAVNALGAGLDVTGIGALAGVPLDILGGVLSAGGVAADVTGVGKGWFGAKPKSKANPKEAALAAVGATNTSTTAQGATPAAASPVDNSTTAQPTILDDDYVMRVRTDALIGNQDAIAQLKKIQEGLDRQTMKLASMQRQQIDAARGTTQAINSGQGYGG